MKEERKKKTRKKEGKRENEVRLSCSAAVFTRHLLKR
jgi:hypothetical protein